MQRLRLGGASGIVCPVNVARFQFSAVFWNRATSHTPVVMGKCRKTQFGGMEYVENRISAGEMSHDSKFAPKIGIVQQNSSFPSVGPAARNCTSRLAGAGPATFAVKRLGDSIDSGYSCESELVLHCFAERSQIQIRVFICQVSENPMQPPPKQR